MHRRLTAILAPLVLVLGACAEPVHRSPATAAAGSDSGLYVAVLRHYLTTPSENSFSDQFPTVYVLDRTDTQAADPTRTMGPGTAAPISPADQRGIATGLADLAEVEFVGSPDQVVSHDHGCAQVPAGSILITLGPPVGGPDRMTVGVNGFVACEGATWLTYVVQRHGAGWVVTGTTGPMAVA
jgi:hypothetical protein